MSHESKNPIVVISTVGTSILNNTRLPQHMAMQVEAINPEQKDADKLNTLLKFEDHFDDEKIIDTALDILNPDIMEETSVRRMSAELNSLSRILEGRTSHRSSELHFITSSTRDGRIAARIIASLCRQRYPDYTVETHEIDGLQVDDASAFRQKALPQLVHRVYAILDEEKHPPATYDLVLNPTGGFKSVVPYLTIIGMLRKIEVQYIFERSDELIMLASLPVSLDYNNFDEQVLATLRRLNGGELLSLAEVQTALDWQQSIESHPAWSLLERVSIDETDHFTLNGLGTIVLEELEKRFAVRTPVFLSQQAKKAYDRMDGERQKRYDNILDNIHDPQMRQSNYHEYGNGAGAKVYKQGSTDERVFYFDDADAVLVAELTRHSGGSSDSYEDVPGRKSDYGRYHKWETS